MLHKHHDSLLVKLSECKYKHDAMQAFVDCFTIPILTVFFEWDGSFPLSLSAWSSS